MRKGIGPALLYTTLTIVIIVLLATLAFTARQPPPPQIAELTPQAQHQITKAPNQLTSNFGSGKGAGTGSGGSTTPTTPATLPNGQPVPTSLPPGATTVSAHHCFGNPPIQIDTDTQGPPCVAYWAGNNGGSTYRGVTGTAIRIMVSANTNNTRFVKDMVSWVNRDFELYGRQLQFVGFEGAPSDCADEKAMADGDWADNIFIAQDPISTDADCFFAEAAHDHMIATQYQGEIGMSSANLASLAPYIWTYQMPYDQQFAETGAFICSQLAGKTASYSPEANLAISKRKFGLIIAQTGTPWGFSYKPLTDELARCGAAINPNDIEVWDDASASSGNTTANANWSQFATNAVTQFNLDHVTTVICAGECGGYLTGQDVASAASAQQYYPEWIFLDTGADFNAYVKTNWGDSSEEQALFNVSYQPSQVNYVDAPVNRALNQVDPGYSLEGYGGLNLSGNDRLYWQFLLLASCIQMAGPDLTPYTFQRGCQAAAFPNPYSPELEGIVGFGDHSHSMTEDADVAWFNAAAPSVYADEGPGTWCYAEGGRRFTAASLATAGNILPPAPLSAAPCDNSPPGS